MKPDPVGLSPALTALATGTEEEREAAASCLIQEGKIAGDLVAPALTELLQSGDTDARWWAARALAEVPGPAATQALIAALADPNEDVRVCAALALGERREWSAVDSLLRALRRAKGYEARHVGDALCKIGEPAVPGLIAALEEPVPTVRVESARALVRIESQKAIPALYKALDDPEPAVEHYAWEALQRMGVGVMVLFRP